MLSHLRFAIWILSASVMVAAFKCFAAPEFDFVDKTPLHEAARKGNVAEIHELIRQGADVNAPYNFTPVVLGYTEGGQGVHGKTALMFAVESGKLAAVEALLAEGADISRTQYHGNTKDVKRTAFDLAIQHDHLDMARAIRASAKNGQAFTGSYNQALMFACIGRCKDALPADPERNLGAFVANSAPSEAEYSDTIAKIACSGSSFEMLRFLKRARGNLPKDSLRSCTLSSGPGTVSRAPMITYLLQENVEADAKKPDGFSWGALHDAAYSLDLEAVNVLLKAGADPNSMVEGHRTPLMFAFYSGCSVYNIDRVTKQPLRDIRAPQRTAVFNALVAAGADPLRRDDAGHGLQDSPVAKHCCARHVPGDEEICRTIGFDAATEKETR